MDEAREITGRLRLTASLYAAADSEGSGASSRLERHIPRAAATRVIDVELARLETTAGSLPWSGTAQLAYNQAQRRWAAVLADLNSILKESRSVASRTGELFRQVEREATALWR